MAFVTSASRFAVLMDDVQDPFDQKKKPKKANSQGTQSSGSNKSNSKANTGSNNQIKKTKPISNGNLATNSQAKPKQNAQGTEPSKTKKTNAKKDKNLPKMDPAWELRDGQFVDGAYEKDLEEAMVQSKMDFELEQKRALSECSKLTKKNAKKKATPVSLGEFNLQFQAQNGKTKVPPEKSDDVEFLMEQFRLEAKIESEKQIAREKEQAILASRNSLINGYDHGHGDGKKSQPDPEASHSMDYKDLLIQQLSAQNEKLEEEVGQLKSKLKKAGELLTNAELKDKAMLVKELEKLSKVNEDMNEELRSVYSQLEQERSKSHASAIELRKLMEQSRRRTQSHTESQ